MRMLLFAMALCVSVPALAQSVIHTVIPLPPPLPEEESPPELICSVPAVKTGSRISKNTKVCKTAREWNELHARGLDVGADGTVGPMRKSNDVGTCGLSCK